LKKNNNNIYSPSLYIFMIYLPSGWYLSIYLYFYISPHRSLMPLYFCRCCDHKGATLTVVLSESGHIFGGVAGASWTGQNTFREDEGAFLFGLRVDGAPGPIKLPIKAEQVGNAVYDWAGSGPGFGSGHDLIIASGANSNSKSHGGGLGTSFTLPPGGGCVITFGAKRFVVCQDSISGV
jgi:hypothetical protein